VLFGLREENDSIMNTISDARCPSWNQLTNTSDLLLSHGQ